VSRLIGAPPGYVGDDEGGQLTEAVRRRPFAVILFDEIEKAHPDVFHALLQVLDDGRLTDGQGRTVDFRNAVIILTSNLGTAGEGGEPREEDVLEEARRHFRPEFWNRLDEVVVFRRLSVEDLESVVDIQAARFAGLLASRRLTLEITPKARKEIARLGFDPVYGARPLKRVIQRQVQDPLASALLEGRFKDGDRVRVALKDGALVLEPVSPPAAVASRPGQ
jgi:ATP-dependent Clp protease ATP-binding subunit ClpB